MTSIITRSGKGSELSYAELDANLDSLNGINEAQTGTTYTVVAADQNRTIEFSNASAIAVTLTAISSLLSSGDTSDFKVTLKNIGAGVVTVTRGGTDTFEDGSTTYTLNQYDSATIQSDSTGAIWNVLSEHVTDAATKTGTETLTNKELTTPSINGATCNATGTEIDVLDGVTGGTAAASKALVLDGSADMTGGINDFTVDNDMTVGGNLSLTGTHNFGLYQQTNVENSAAFSSSDVVSLASTPTSSNGVQIASRSLTMRGASTDLRIEYGFMLGASADIVVGVAFFNGTTLLRTVGQRVDGNASISHVGGAFTLAAPGSGSITITARMFVASTGTGYVNRTGAGSTWGTSMNTSLILSEVA